MNHRPILFALGLAATPLLAQKLPLPDGRTLQLIDLRVLDDPDPAARDALHYGGLAEFLKQFIEPVLDAESGVEMLGTHQLAVLGTPQQCAWVEKVVVLGARQRDTQIIMQMSLMEVSAEQYAGHLKSFFEPAEVDGRHVRITEREAVDKLAADLGKDGASELAAPGILARNLQRASMHMGDTIRYVGDFETGIVDGKPVAIAVNREVFDGFWINLRPAVLAEDTLGIDCKVHLTEIARPLCEASIQIGSGRTETVQLPRLDTVEFRQAIALPKGSSAAIATRRSDGRWLLTLVSARVTR